MKHQIQRKRTCCAFLVMGLMATAIPYASVGEIKITASRDYVDKKVAAVSNALERTIFNQIKDSLDTNNFKTNQAAVVDPTANGNATSFIATIEQNVNGEITVTKKTIPNATTNIAGIVQLSSETTSTDDSKAATLKAVSEVRAIAVAKQDPATTLDGYGITDAKIANGTVTLGDASITPLTADSDLTTDMGRSVDSKILSATNAAVESVTVAVANGYKPKQMEKDDPIASGNGIDYIATISQDTNGVITATKSTVRSASTDQTGVVKLNDAVDSESTTEAATANAVKTVMDETNTKVPLNNISVGGTPLTNETVVELGNAYIVFTTEGDGATAKKKAVLYVR